MEMEYILTKEQILRINRIYGGSLRTDAEIETAMELGRGHGIYKKIAYLWRAILIGHPFTDGNKRTAVGSAIVMIECIGKKLHGNQRNRLAAIAEEIAEKSIADISRIERRIRYAVERN